MLVFFILIGFIDDFVKYFKFEEVKRWGITSVQKIILQTIGIFTFLFFGNYPVWVIPIALIFIIFITNSFNITDGLDGLVGTVSLYVFPVLAYFEYMSERDTTLLLLVFSFMIIFLYFNVKPARIFLGDVGSLSLGVLLGILALNYKPLPILILFGIIIIEGLSSLVQIFFIKVFKKKLFIIAPLHLHLLNCGWADTKVVQRFGLLQFLLSISAVYAFHFL